MRSVCVFSGSSPGARPDYAAAARALGNELAARNLRVVYGGGGVGLMGLMADAALAAGAEVVGVIPRQLVDWEVAHRGLSDLRVTGSMHERKALMAELAEGFIALPGGFGTLEEFAEVVTWSQLGLQSKPCGLLDVAGFYGPLLTFLDRAAAERFIRAEHRELVLTDTDPARLLDTMSNWTPPPDTGKWIDRDDAPAPLPARRPLANRRTRPVQCAARVASGSWWAVHCSQVNTKPPINKRPGHAGANSGLAMSRTPSTRPWLSCTKT